jgi:hypothetical protein
VSRSGTSRDAFRDSATPVIGLLVGKKDVPSKTARFTYCQSAKYRVVCPPTHINRSDHAGRNSPMKREVFAVSDIYVPVKRRATLEQKRVDEIASSMLEVGQQMPILVRPDGARFVLIEGLHRLEAAKALGETTIVGYRVSARKH